MKNTSGLSKYLWLWRILDVDFSYFLQLWTLQLFQIPPAMNDSSYFKYLWLWKIPPALDYLRIHFFLVESCLKGLVHSGSSCRSWTTLLLPCETWLDRLNVFIRLKADHSIYTDYIHRYLVEVSLVGDLVGDLSGPTGQDTRCPYMTGRQV